MISNADDLVKLYTRIIAKEGFSTENCENLAWATDQVKGQPDLSFEGLMDAVEAKIKGGSADHGWLIEALRVSWPELATDQRLYILRILHDGGALKALVGKRFFNFSINQIEKDFVTECLRRSKAVAALRRLDG